MCHLAASRDSIYTGRRYNRHNLHPYCSCWALVFLAQWIQWRFWLKIKHLFQISLWSQGFQRLETHQRSCTGYETSPEFPSASTHFSIFGWTFPLRKTVLKIYNKASSLNSKTRGLSTAAAFCWIIQMVSACAVLCHLKLPRYMLSPL